MIRYGVGLRSVHADYLLRTPPDQWGVDWFEAISEDYLDGRSLLLDQLATQRPVALHGVSLNIGGTDPLDTGYLCGLRLLADRISPVWVSDHLCWTGVDGINTHDLLPLPYTEKTLAHVAARVSFVQEVLDRPLVLENPSNYLEWNDSEMPEWEFLTLLVKATECRILLDINNLAVTATNPYCYIAKIPIDAIAYMHIAGHTIANGKRIDTHDQPVCPEVWDLYQKAQQLTGGVDVLLEWDANIPPWLDLVTELDKARRLDGSA